MAKFWVCPLCATRNARVKQKCAGEGCARSRPKPRVPVHARTLRDDNYETYLQAAKDIHGLTAEECCVCGRERSQERRHDRDHGHLQGDPSFGKPRGLACVPCNRLMVRELDVERARLVWEYLARVDNWYRADGLEDAA